ncbi:hypothetical protein B296_00038861 [Ensete ventricosum]|uniref:Uncharacterized protein n=1 Tax=Ensete ventricosum TaxID=4639 RepID=A0A426XN44_ENSVE|nr:hypothetical protein B296_00038861 [Ensete ventricosum]
MIGGDGDRGVCIMGVCQDSGHRVGMGRDHLALQLGHLLPSRRPQVHHPLRAQRQGLGQPSREQGLPTLRDLIESHCGTCISLTPYSSTKWLQTAFTSKKDYGRGEREAQWALAQRTLHGLQPADTSGLFNDKSGYRELSEIAEQAKKRAEVAR